MYLYVKQQSIEIEPNVNIMNTIAYRMQDYKTPSMAECESLGVEIGLHKRVVQVWFQNARAKERKSRAASGQDANAPLSSSSPRECALCQVTYAAGAQSLQEHVFSASHIANVRAHLKANGTDDTGTATMSQTLVDSPPPAQPLTATIKAEMIMKQPKRSTSRKPSTKQAPAPESTTPNAAAVLEQLMRGQQQQQAAANPMQMMMGQFNRKSTTE